MQLELSTVVVLVSVLGVFTCYAEEHLIPKDGMQSRHIRRKRDLEEAELLLKALLSKRGHSKELERLDEGYEASGDRYIRGSEFRHGSTEGMRHLEKSEPLDRHHKGQKSVVLTETEMAELLEKMARLVRAEQASSVKYGESGDSHYVESHPRKMEMMMAEETDKFGDKGVSLAETLFHMKMAGDVETYPEVKMASLYKKKQADEESRVKADHSLPTDESYMKKVDEIGKSLIKEEVYPHIKDESILKDAKTHHVLKDIIPEGVEEKSLEKWKHAHKDLFSEESHVVKDEFLDEDHQAKGALTHGIDEKLLKELKHSLGFDKDLAAEEEEYLLSEKGVHFDKEKVHEELLKKAKMFLDEKLSDRDPEKALEILKQLEKELKEKELAFGKEASSIDAHGLGHFEKGISDEKAHISKDFHGSDHIFQKELLTEKGHAFDTKDHVGTEVFKDEVLAHGINDALLKKLKTALGMSKEFGNEELLHMVKNFQKDGVVFDKEQKELIQLLEEFEKEKATKEGTEAYAKAKEQADKDSHIGFDEAQMKKHSEESLIHDSHTIHEKDAHFGFDEEEFKKHIEESLKHGIHEKDVHIGFDEEELKKHIGGSLAHSSHGMHEKDEHIGFNEEELKKHIEESLKHGVHEKDAHIGFGEEELKKHVEESLKHGIHEKDIKIDEDLKKHIEDSLAHGTYDKELFDKEHTVGKNHAISAKGFEAGLSIEKAHGIDTKEIHNHGIFHEKGLAAGEADAHGIKHFVSEGKEHGFAVKDHHGLAAKEAHDIHHQIETDVDKSLHGIYEEGAMYDKKHGVEATLDIEKSLHGVRNGEKHHIRHGIAHADADKTFSVHNDEKARGTDFFLHEDKEFVGAGEEHPIHHVLKGEEDRIFHGDFEKHHVEGDAESEKKHKASHQLRTKVAELLAALLKSRKCHLVTMTPPELLGIVNCISKSQDPLVCEKYAECEKQKPIRVVETQEKCQKEIAPGLKTCTRYAPLFASRDIPLKIFQCVAIRVRELVGEERKKMIEFEKCARLVKADSCERHQWFRRRH